MQQLLLQPFYNIKGIRTVENKEKSASPLGIMRMMNMISRGEGAYRTRRLGEESVWGYRHSFILAICNSPGMPQDSLARALCLNKSTIARTLSQMEDDGLVIRKACESDKRRTLVYPSDKMLEIYPRVKNITREWNELLAEGISEGELEAFRRVLSLMYERAVILADTEADGQ